MIAPGQIDFRAPTFGGLLDAIWAFVLAWVIKYWWIVFIFIILWYTRWYRVAFRAGRPNPSFAAFQLTLRDAFEMLNTTGVKLVAAGMIVVAFTLWILKAVGTLYLGTLGFEPVIIANAVTALVSLAAGLGVDAFLPFTITPRLAIGVFVGVLFISVFWAMAVREAQG